MKSATEEVSEHTPLILKQASEEQVVEIPISSHLAIAVPPLSNLNAQQILILSHLNNLQQRILSLERELNISRNYIAAIIVGLTIGLVASSGGWLTGDKVKPWVEDEYPNSWFALSPLALPILCGLIGAGLGFAFGFGLSLGISSALSFFHNKCLPEPVVNDFTRFQNLPAPEVFYGVKPEFIEFLADEISQESLNYDLASLSHLIARLDDLLQSLPQENQIQCEHFLKLKEPVNVLKKIVYQAEQAAHPRLEPQEITDVCRNIVVIYMNLLTF